MNKILAIVFVFCFRFSIGQTWQSYNPTFGFDVNAVAVLGPGSIAAGGGQETNDSFQIMVHTDDYGHSWNENIHDGLAPWNKSIAFSGPLNGFGAGNDGRIIQTNDGGLHWGFEVTPFSRDWNKIVNVDAQTYFLAGGNRSNDSLQSILKTNDGGVNWLLVLDQPGPWLKSLAFINASNGVAVGDSGVILKTINGGGLWTTVTPPVQRDFTGITFVNGNTGFITGGNSNHRTILRTDDGGNNWTVVMDTTGGILNDITFAGAATGYAVGDSATVLKTIDGGINWLPEVVDTALNGNEEIRTVDFYNENFGVLAGKQGLLYVYLGSPLPYTTFRTDQASAVSYTSATLNATVKGLQLSASLTFEYDTTVLFSKSVLAIPALVTDTLQHSIMASVGSLQPYTIYYYRLRGVAGNDTLYSNAQTFFTSAPDSYNSFQTSYATHVTDTSAVLNGLIQNFYYPTSLQLSFDYGPTEAFGSETALDTLIIHDTLSHEVVLPISGLSSDTMFYYYRLKVVAGSDIHYGNTRRVYTGEPEVPNWDFQHWQNNTVELPNRWKAFHEAPERVPGNSGFAAKISGKNILLLGAFYNTRENGETGPAFFDGAPFHYRPDSVSVYLNYYVEPGDAALLFVKLYTATDTVAQSFIPITGSSGGIFKKISFAIPYNSTLTPDSLILGFVSSNFGAPLAYSNNYLIIDDISFGTAAPQLPNYNFESWFTYSYNKLLNWDYYQFFTAEEPVNTPMVEQVQFDNASDYAAEIHTIAVNGKIIDGSMATKAMGPLHDGEIAFAVAGKHLSLNGYFKYFPVNGDTLKLQVSLYKSGLNIGNGVFFQVDSIISYTPFNVELYYPDTGIIPDSATILIQPFKAPAKGFSRIVVDKLSFDGFRINALDTFHYTSSTRALMNDNIKIYPNPTNNDITVEFPEPLAQEGIATLYSLNGQQLKEIRLKANEPKITFSVLNLEDGVYFLRLQSGALVFNRKIVVLN